MTIYIAQIVLVVLASLIELGGIIGFKAAGSKASLIAGVISGGLLLAAFAVTFVELVIGLWIGAGVCVLLTIVFLMRVARTGKMMPSGMLLLLCVGAGAYLAYAANGGGGPVAFTL